MKKGNPMSHTKDKSTSKQKYKLRNWSNYDKSLKKRGSLEIWVEKKTLKNWHYKGKKVKGGNFFYSDLAIKLCLTLKSIYKLPLRQTTGFAESIFALMHLPLSIPNYTTLSRRASHLKIKLPKLQAGQSIALVLDSTGLKIYEAGEWKNRKYEGHTFRKGWKKLHIAMGAENQIIYSSELTNNGVTDAQIVSELLKTHEKHCYQLIADGAYDKKDVYKYLYNQKIKPIIPPRKDAVVSKNEPSYLYRNAAIEVIGKDKEKRKEWKKKVGYHRRSLVETCMYRYKKIFGERLSFRKDSNRKIETILTCSLLNKMWSLGRPESYKVA